MVPDVAAEISGQAAANFGAEATTESSIAWMRVASAGIGSPGLTSCRNAAASSSLPLRSGTAPISTTRAFVGSRPVVSVSMTKASSAIKGVALPNLAIRAPWRRTPHRHFYSLIKIDPDHAPNVPLRNGCPCRSMFRRGIDIGIFRVPLSRSKNRLNPTALLEQPLFYCGLQLIEPIDMALAEAELAGFFGRA